MDAQAWSAVIQAICAVVAIIITIAISKQTLKIRELSDVTDSLINQNKELVKQTKELVRHTEEMKKSNEIFQKRFELEYQISLTKRVPYFKRFDNAAQVSIDTALSTTYAIHLQNHGTKALNITYSQTEKDTPIYSVFIHNQEVDTNGVMKIDVRFLKPEYADSQFYDFSIIFFTNDNAKLYQRIKQDDIHLDRFRIYAPAFTPDFFDTQ